MTVVIVFGVIALALFAGAYISRRRFGLLGLALTAGATLTGIWSYDAGLLVASTGLIPDAAVANAVTLSLIVLTPPILLLFHGYSYKGGVGRLIGAFLFTALALAFLVEPIGYALPLEGAGVDAYTALVEYKDVIISVGVILAIVDLFLTKPAALTERKRKH